MNTSHPWLSVLFWACFAGVFYTYAIYPPLIWLLARFFGKNAAPDETPKSWPRLSILIAACNEQSVIASRVANALATDYPADRLEIVVASDGSVDSTCDIVRSHAACGVRLLEYDRRRGKAATLNDAMAELAGEIVLLSDANTEIDPCAARRLAQWFCDPKVGAVCGRLVLTDPLTGKNVDGIYWKYETLLKRCEGRLGALLGANGAIYAIRRSLYSPAPSETAVEDFVIPLLMRLRSRCRIVYDFDAVAREQSPADLGTEFHRRVRIGTGGFQAIRLLHPLLNPRHGWVAYTFFSHKVLRWLCPFLLLVMLVASGLLGDSPVFKIALAAQIGFYGLSLLTALLPARMRSLRVMRLAHMFTSMNAALLLGFCRWAAGSGSGVWRRTPRPADVGA